ncbi:MAG: hypothetical protein JW709_02000 [Sedimentisphaerales bacterium]|nr:hypothetical protein [Sedimentisphaerales bacterium]
MRGHPFCKILQILGKTKITGSAANIPGISKKIGLENPYCLTGNANPTSTNNWNYHPNQYCCQGKYRTFSRTAAIIFMVITAKNRLD